MDIKGKIYVISPFKLVADKCKREIKILRKVQCGTIHTFQGKESDVAGSQPKKESTRNWTSSKPKQQQQKDHKR